MVDCKYLGKIEVEFRDDHGVDMGGITIIVVKSAITNNKTRDRNIVIQVWQ